MVRITDLKNKYIPIYKKNGIYTISWDYVEIKEESGDPIIASWTFEKFSNLPSIDYIKNMICDYYDKQTTDLILSGFEWHGYSVWLSIENQTNYKNALDLATQSEDEFVPVTFRFNSSEGPVYYLFDTLDELKEFWTACSNHIKKCLNEGWQKKDSINWSEYEIPTELVSE